MNDPAWTLAASIDQVFATTISAIGLVFSGVGLIMVVRQAKVAQRASDFGALIELERTMREREASLLAADSVDKKKQAFIDFLNFLETIASALNENLLQTTSRTLAEDKLCSSIAVIQNSPAWHYDLQKAVTSSTTFKDLVKFVGKHRKTIDAYVIQLNQQ
jgi:hypothetical protein